MSLLPLVKIASDHIQEPTLVKLGFSWWDGPLGKPMMGLAGKTIRGLGRLGLGTARIAGRGAWGGAKLFGNAAQGTGRFIVNHPRAALGIVAPIGLGATQLVDKSDQYQNNIVPENPYRYGE